MTNAKDKSSEEEGNGIESPVDGPTPDWMRLATSAGSGPSLTEDKMPAWLKSIKAGKGFTKEEPQPTQSQPAPEPPPATSSSDDTMSDLERLLAEEGIDLSGVAEERPEGSENMSTRDWLIATSSEEIIRNKKLDVGPAAEEPPPPPTPVVAQAAGSPPPATSSSDDTMSDLERLLAEEGIDLSGVAEERPEGSENMSTRDWLIATSSEEIIRNKKLDVGPAAEEPPPLPTPVAPQTPIPHPAPSFSDDKMVVQEDLPDWLRDIAEESGEPAAPTPAFETLAALPEEDQFVVKEELPEWLQEIAEESVTPPSPPTVDTSLLSDDKMVVEEDLPDWLQEMAEEPTEAPIVEPIQPTPPEPPPTPVIKRPGTGPLSRDKMIVEEDLPDWLREVEEETPAAPARESLPVEMAPATEVSPPTAEADKMVVEEDLPDWLRELSDESPVVAEAESAWVDTAASPLPTTSFDEDKMIVEEDLPEWLREASAEETGLDEELIQPGVLEADKTVAAEDLPDWLRELESGAAASGSVLDETDLTFASTDLDMIDSDEDLPDWLREVEASSEVEELLTPAVEIPEPRLEPVTLSSEEWLSVDEEEEELPNWLKEVQEHEGEVEPSVPVPKPVAVTPEPISPSPDLIVEEELPDWLKEVQEHEGEVEPFVPVPEPVTVTPEPISSTSDLIVGEELPDWLKEVQEEPEPLALKELPALPEFEPGEDLGLEEEELPDWLREAQLDIEEPFEPSEPSPEPFAEVEAEELIIEEELPDWLQEVPTELPLVSEVEAPSPVLAETAGVSEAELVDETGLPDWLRGAEEEVEPAIITPPVTEAIAAEEIGEEFVEEFVPAEELIEEVPVSLPPAPTIEVPAVAAPTGIPDWLQKLREVQVEEEPVPVLAAPPLVSVGAAPARVAPEPVLAQAAPSPEPVFPPEAEERFRQAQIARDKGDFEGATRLYNSLISSGAFLDKIIEDMQHTIKSHPDHYLLYQVMGDAMMRNGRLQSALKAYREALTKLH